MTNYYSNSIDYHNDLDTFEARVRAEQAMAEYDESRRVFTIDDYEAQEQPEQCVCLEYAGDDPRCPIHGWMNEQEGSDTSMSAQLNDSGFCCSSAWWNSIEEIPF